MKDRKPKGWERFDVTCDGCGREFLVLSHGCYADVFDDGVMCPACCAISADLDDPLPAKLPPVVHPLERGGSRGKRAACELSWRERMAVLEHRLDRTELTLELVAELARELSRRSRRA